MWYDIQNFKRGVDNTTGATNARGTTRTISTIMYHEGVVADNVTLDGKFYKNGVPVNGLYTDDEGITTYWEDGKLASGVYQKTYPNQLFVNGYLYSGTLIVQKTPEYA